MSSYQYRKYHCVDKTVVRSSYLHNGISYTGKMAYLYWFSPLVSNQWDSLSIRIIILSYDDFTAFPLPLPVRTKKWILQLSNYTFYHPHSAIIVPNHHRSMEIRNPTPINVDLTPIKIVPTRSCNGWAEGDVPLSLIQRNPADLVGIIGRYHSRHHLRSHINVNTSQVCHWNSISVLANIIGKLSVAF